MAILSVQDFLVYLRYAKWNISWTVSTRNLVHVKQMCTMISTACCIDGSVQWIHICFKFPDSVLPNLVREYCKNWVKSSQFNFWNTESKVHWQPALSPIYFNLSCIFLYLATWLSWSKCGMFKITIRIILLGQK